MTDQKPLLRPDDALLVVDVQRDFLPGGALAVPDAGALFAEGLRLAPEAQVVSKGVESGREAYSAFAGTDLERKLREAGVRRLVVGGLATDYCVLQTVLDARSLGFDVVVLRDAIAAVDARDGAKALDDMAAAGAHLA